MRPDQAAAIESRLLALMRDPAANRMGVRSATINSTDLYDWTENEASLAAGATSGRHVGQNGAPLSISVTAALLSVDAVVLPGNSSVMANWWPIRTSTSASSTHEIHGVGLSVARSVELIPK